MHLKRRGGRGAEGIWGEKAQPQAVQGAVGSSLRCHRSSPSLSPSDLISFILFLTSLPKVRASQLREELQGAQARLAQAEAQSRALERRVSELTQYSAQLEGRVSELERAVAERDQRAERTAREVEGRMREV